MITLVLTLRTNKTNKSKPVVMGTIHSIQTTELLPKTSVADSWTYTSLYISVSCISTIHGLLYYLPYLILNKLPYYRQN